MKKVVVNETNKIMYGNVSDKTGKLAKNAEDITNGVLDAITTYLANTKDFKNDGIAMHVGVVEGKEIVLTVADPDEQIVLTREEYAMLAREAGRI